MPSTPPSLVAEGPAYDLAGLVHRVQVPAYPGPHPTVIMLHGRSGSEEVMWIFAQSIPAHWLVLSPRGMRRDPQGGYSWHPRSRDEWPALPQFDEAVGRVVRFIGALPELYGADAQSTYLMGFSQGAATSYAVAIRYPGLIRGIAGLVGFVPTRCDDVSRLAPLSDLPIFMAVGRRDEIIPRSRSIACAQTLRAAGADLEYQDYDTGHRLNKKGMRDLAGWWQDREQQLR